MTGADTNLIVRLLARDVEVQAHRVKLLLDKGTVLYINEVVLAELFWVLRHVYDYSKNDVILAIDRLLETRNIKFFNHEVVRYALTDYIHSSAGFVDCLISRINELVTSRTYTFDKRASVLEGMTLLESD